MSCELVQAEISRTLDEGGALLPRAARHLLECPDCEEFRVGAIRLTERYATEVRAGIDRLRGTGKAAAAPRRPALLAAAFAAACLLGWWGMIQTPPAAPAVVRAPEAAVLPASRVRLFESPELVDREEVSFLFEREALPVRLDQDLLPTRSDLSEIHLPASLRF
ncbi:MAG TPA: hypothetical protein VNM14_23725 [Planctomycetota bacterium]|nr:hypothetical protein [Planctomycetota bacterium]